MKRVNKITVALEDGIDEGYVDKIIKAIECINGVCGVSANETDSMDFIYKKQIKSELRTSFLELWNKL